MSEEYTLPIGTVGGIPPSSMKLLSSVGLFETLWTVAYQAPPSMGSPGKNTGVGCHIAEECLKKNFFFN